MGRLSAALVLLFMTFDPCAAQLPAPPYPPPGQLIDVGGYPVHLYCTGEGSPTVVVVGAGFSFDWGLVQPAVAKFTRICTYDVSGTAWSDAGPLLTCSERVNEVHKLLNKARIEGPYVLVGLSVGALVARLYASQNPSEVAGLVMVDHAFIDVGGESASPHSSPGAESLVVSTGNDLPDYKKLQTELLSLSTRSQQVIADRSFHSVEIDQPEVVVDAIQQVVNMLRRTGERH